MTGDIDRLKQDLATMEQAIGNTANYGPQHVGMHLGLGIGGVATLTLGTFTDLLETMPTRLVIVPLFLGLPIVTAWMFSERPFHFMSLFKTGPAKTGSNRLAVIIGVAIVGFAFFIDWVGAPKSVMPAVAMMLSAVYLATVGWGQRQHSYLLLAAAAFFLMAIAFPLVPKGFVDEVFGTGLAIAGFGSAAMLYFQINKREPDVATH
jgi:hypothetical protein